MGVLCRKESYFTQYSSSNFHGDRYPSCFLCSHFHPHIGSGNLHTPSRMMDTARLARGNPTERMRCLLSESPPSPQLAAKFPWQWTLSESLTRAITRVGQPGLCPKKPTFGGNKNTASELGDSEEEKEQGAFHDACPGG